MTRAISEKNESFKNETELHFLRQMKIDDTKNIQNYTNKFVEKFYKIYKKLNVKVVSMEVLKNEINSEFILA